MLSLGPFLKTITILILFWIPILIVTTIDCSCYGRHSMILMIFVFFFVVLAIPFFIVTGLVAILLRRRLRGITFIVMGFLWGIQIVLPLRFAISPRHWSDAVNVQIRRPTYALHTYFRPDDQAGQLDIFPFGEGDNYTNIVVYDPTDGPLDADRLKPVLCRVYPGDCTILDLRPRPMGGHLYLVDLLYD